MEVSAKAIVAGLVLVGADASAQSILIVSDEITGAQVLVKTDSIHDLKLIESNFESINTVLLSAQVKANLVRKTTDDVATRDLLGRVQRTLGNDSKVKIVPIHQMKLSTQDWASE